MGGGGRLTYMSNGEQKQGKIIKIQMDRKMEKEEITVMNVHWISIYSK